MDGKLNARVDRWEGGNRVGGSQRSYKSGSYLHTGNLFSLYVYLRYWARGFSSHWSAQLTCQHWHSLVLISRLSLPARVVFILNCPYVTLGFSLAWGLAFSCRRLMHYGNLSRVNLNPDPNTKRIFSGPLGENQIDGQAIRVFENECILGFLLLFNQECRVTLMLGFVGRQVPRPQSIFPTTSYTDWTGKT